MKKKIMIAVGSLVILAGCVLAVMHFTRGNGSEDTLKMVQIEFPQAAGGMTNDVEFEVDNDYEVKNEEILHKVYSTNNNDIDKKVKKIIKRYDVSGEKMDMGDMIRYGEAGRSVVKYGDKSISFSDTSKGQSEVTISDDECVSIAKKELEKLDLLTDGMEYGNVSYTTQSKVGSEEEIIIVKTVNFSRKLDGVDVMGHSFISVDITGSGDVIGVIYECGNVGKEYEVEDDKIISVDEALEACKNSKGSVSVPEDADKVVIESVECVYWEDSAPGSKNYTIQPVYRISGKAYSDGKECGEFVAYESAVNVI